MAELAPEYVEYLDSVTEAVMAVAREAGLQGKPAVELALARLNRARYALPLKGAPGDAVAGTGAGPPPGWGSPPS